jgi:glycopeptide antibiotics resistance protein
MVAVNLIFYPVGSLLSMLQSRSIIKKMLKFIVAVNVLCFSVIQYVLHV